MLGRRKTPKNWKDTREKGRRGRERGSSRAQIGLRVTIWAGVGLPPDLPVCPLMWGYKVNPPCLVGALLTVANA